jgi:putative transposase
LWGRLATQCHLVFRGCGEGADKTFYWLYVLFMDSPEVVRILELFRRVAPPQYWRRQSARAGFEKRGIFCLPVVVWMMMMQRLEPNGTVASAVQQLRRGGFRRLLRRCKRVREGRISAASGGYCQARQKLSKLVISQIVDELLQRLQAALEESQPSGPGRVFVLDGSSLLLQHRPDLQDAYPPGKTQCAEGHWPVLRLVVCQAVESGLALRPCWGPMFGSQAVSEQKLAEQVLERLPEGAVVMGDRNFGVFSVAWAAQQRQNPMILRLTNARAQRLLRKPLTPGLEEAVVWQPSRDDRRAHPEIPAGASLRGRVVVAQLKGARNALLCLFTTLDQTASQLLELYRRRWNVETDLRSLKRTLRLHHISARSVEMMEKELLLAIAAYNFVRTVICLAAHKAGLSPRQISFTSVYSLVQVHLSDLLLAKSAKAWQQHMDQLIDYAAAYKLPRRDKPRSFPRAVWGSGFRFALRKAHDKTK